MGIDKMVLICFRYSEIFVYLRLTDNITSVIVVVVENVSLLMSFLAPLKSQKRDSYTNVDLNFLPIRVRDYSYLEVIPR